MNYQGSCHAGKSASNRSTLSRRWSATARTATARLPAVVRAAQPVHLSTTDAELATYTFNKHVIQHHSAPPAAAPFRLRQGPQGRDTAAINVRCLEAWSRPR